MEDFQDALQLRFGDQWYCRIAHKVFAGQLAAAYKAGPAGADIPDVDHAALEPSPSGGALAQAKPAFADGGRSETTTGCISQFSINFVDQQHRRGIHLKFACRL